MTVSDALNIASLEAQTPAMVSIWTDLAGESQTESTFQRLVLAYLYLNDMTSVPIS